ncbi:MAG: branched-chain amino acid ABC transporter substrate-binding protein [Vulcanimicrobiaceae bacterium]
MLAASASGCSSRSPGNGASSAGGTIKIGIDLPVSGADASTGIPTRNGAVLAIEQAARKGLPGGFTLVAYDLDDAVQGTHDPNQGAQNTRAFISDPSVLAMIGPFNSNVAAAEIPLTNDAGLTQISPANTNPGLTKGPQAAALRTAHPETNAYFRVCATDDRQGLVGAEFARKRGFRRAFVVDDNETYGKGLADVFATDFAARGGTVVDREHLTRGQTDFKALLTKAAALRPDVVYYGGTTSTGGGLLRHQMADAGLGDVPMIGGDGIADAEFFTVAGTSANGVTYSVAAPNVQELPSAATFIAQYTARWHTPPGPYSANAYAAAQIEIAAIERTIVADHNALPTRAQVRALVAATHDFPSPIGKIGFDAAGDTSDPILSLYTVENGAPRFIAQFALASVH